VEIVAQCIRGVDRCTELVVGDKESRYAGALHVNQDRSKEMRSTTEASMQRPVPHQKLRCESPSLHFVIEKSGNFGVSSTENPVSDNLEYKDSFSMICASCHVARTAFQYRLGSSFACPTCPLFSNCTSVTDIPADAACSRCSWTSCQAISVSVFE
jgi:hypothetical protein